MYALSIIAICVVRVDFHPNTNENEEKADGDDGCKRCGYKVFDAERMMAAGRVRNARVRVSNNLF